ncbi:MAG: hypothetical protein ACRD50_09845 [Candidatus Acidiferrales bacterium]
MANEQEPQEKTGQGVPAKKPYVKPRFKSEQIFETLALSCGKLPGQGGQCNATASQS